MAERGQVVNGATLSAIFGISPSTIVKWVQGSCPAVVRGHKGREWQFDTAAVADWYAERAVRNAVGNTADVAQEELKRRKLAAETTSAEVQAAKDIGSVFPYETIDEVLGPQLDRLRAKLLGQPSKVAPLVAVENDPAVCQSILDAAVHEALDEIVGWAAVSIGASEGRGSVLSTADGASEGAAKAEGLGMGRSVSPSKRGSKRRARKVEH